VGPADMKHKKEVLKSNLYFLLETCYTESFTEIGKTKQKKMLT